MIFKSLSGREYRFDIRPQKNPHRNKEDCASKLQWEVGQAIREVFPGFVILEEFCAPGENLRLDFFLPQIMVAVEADGCQHKKFSPFFHRTRQVFQESVARDYRKKQWCELNQIALVQVTDASQVRAAIEEALSDVTEGLS